METWQLRQKQSLPLEAKINLTKHRLYSFLNKNHGYISYSGGVDSDVLRHIALQVHSNLKVLFVETYLQYPEIRERAKQRADVVVKPDMMPKEVIDKYGYPVPTKEQAQYIEEYRTTNSEKLKKKRWEGDENGSYKISDCWKCLVDAPFKVSKKCCTKMKNKPFEKYESKSDEYPIIGTQAEESQNRYNSYLNYGCNNFESDRPTSRPLSFWTKQDILKYIQKYDLDYCYEIYGEIKKDRGRLYTTKRQQTGCSWCTFGIHMEGKPNRYQKLARSHPGLWNYAVNELGFGDVLDYIGVPYKPDPRLFKV